ncbi:MAG: thioredoxin family protein [Planctomycetaceae bacterium]
MATRPTICCIALLLLTNFSFAQGEIRGGSLFEKINRGESSRIGHGIEVRPQPEVTSKLTTDGTTYTLSLRLELPEGANTYSQNPEFSGQTRISVTHAKGLQPLSNSFTPDQTPKASYDDNFGKSVEKFFGTVIWSREFQLVPGADPGDVAVSGMLSFKMCDATGCFGKRIPFEIKNADIQRVGGLAVEPATLPEMNSVELASGTTERVSRTRMRSSTTSDDTPKFILPGDASPLPAIPSFTEDEPLNDAKIKYAETVTPRGGINALPLTLTLTLSPENASPGSEVTLSVTANVEPDWHIFALKKAPNQIGTPTSFPLDALRNLTPSGEWIADHPPVIEESTENTSEATHHGVITWSRKFQVVGPGAYGIDGAVRFQVCKTGQCRPGKHIFSLGDSTIPAIPMAQAGAETTSESAGDSVAFSSETVKQRLEEKRGAAAHLGWQLLFAFLGGLILNIMPCVLPVLPIKALSFVQQAGESRQRIIMLNLAYTLGVVAVFMLLGGMAALAGANWGALFQTSGFNLVMACVIFAMALSLLGVYEIPIPGFIGSGGGAEHQEGLFAAVMTGVTTTLLATPCLGPFMGVTLAWMVTQPPAISFLICGVMAIGMSSPYLALGLFPRLLDFLPRPGMWMVRFKELCGFALLGTVLMLIGSAGEKLVFPGLIIMLALGLALWMIGQLAGHGASEKTKGIVYSLALLVVGGSIGWFAWDRSEPHLAWQPFTEEALEEAALNKKTVLVDFTADWCMTCKQNERFALNRKATFDFVEEHDVVVMKADFTKEDPEIAKWIDLLGQPGVPLTAIFPANRPNDPILIPGVYTNGMLMERLRAAIDPAPSSANGEKGIDATKLVTPDPASETTPSRTAMVPLIVPETTTAQ